MKKLLLAISLLLLFASPAFALEGSKVEIKAVAVTSGEEPRGVAINITVIVAPGSGHVFVSTVPYTEIDMQGSARLAAVTACDLLGVDFMKYDFFYIIEADAPIVGGPSAGGVMTIATIAAIKNLPLRKDVFMTGMIYPDGFIGPVGGLKYKLEAAAENGGKVFLIPEGQRVTYVEERIVKRVGILNVVTTRYVKVDLVEYGRKLGVDVYEISTINDALKFYSGYEIAQPEINFSVARYSDLLKILAEEMKARLREFELSGKAKQLAEEGDKYYAEGMYYTATSKYFQASIQARYALYLRQIQTVQQFDREVRVIEEKIESLKRFLKNEELGVNSFQIIAAAEERMGEAEKLVEDAQNADSKEEAFFDLAYARQRVESAEVWLTLLDRLGNDYAINAKEVERRAEFYISQASSLIVYASSLKGNEELLSMAVDSLEIAKRLFSEGLYAGAAVKAVDAIVDSSLAIEAAYGKVSDKLSVARERAKAAIGEAEQRIVPILPAAYYEYAESLSSDYLKLMYYKLSERLAKLLGIMAKVGGERELVHAKFLPKRSESRIQEIIEAPGFEAIAAIAALASAAAVRSSRR